MSSTAIRCSACDAVCCRLIVALDPSDTIPPAFVGRTEAGLRVMRRDADGWCSALDREHRSCSIYADRPSTCRRFVMGGGYCRGVRADHADRIDRGIALIVH